MACPGALSQTMLAAKQMRPEICGPAVRQRYGLMSRTWFPSVVSAVMIAVTCPAIAQGKVPLAEESHINEQLIAAAAGDMLRQTCPTLSARMLVVLLKMKRLESYARSKGYDEEEVTLFLKDKAEKARVKAAAIAYLTAAGVQEGDVESYCAVGRAEISNETLVGSLLWSSE
jgi:Family of unknown function (DUF5333)